MPILSLLAICLWLCCAAIARAGDVSAPLPPAAIWSGLILATNDPHPAQPPACLRQVAGKLKNIFGYNQFELIGENSEKMDDPYERWLIPSKDFCLSVKTHNDPGEHYPMKIALFQNRRRLAEFETHLGADSPLFIRGPLYAGGQLVIVLRVVDASEIPARALRPSVIAANPSPAFGAPQPKDKMSTIPANVGAAATQRFNPTPVEHGPLPAERGPVESDHFGPGDRPGGDMDQKGMKP